jgi:hypothetical protein
MSVIFTSVLVNIGFLCLPSVLNDIHFVTLLITGYAALQVLFEFYAFTLPPLSEHLSRIFLPTSSQSHAKQSAESGNCTDQAHGNPRN